MYVRGFALSTARRRRFRLPAEVTLLVRFNPDSLPGTLAGALDSLPASPVIGNDASSLRIRSLRGIHANRLSCRTALAGGGAIPLSAKTMSRDRQDRFALR